MNCKLVIYIDFLGFCSMEVIHAVVAFRFIGILYMKKEKKKQLLEMRLFISFILKKVSVQY